MATEKFTAKQIIKALKETKGMVYLAADKLNCDPKTIYNYAKRYVTVQEAIDTERGKFIDVAELALARAVQGGQGWAVCFALKTLGKNRGYVERQEITGKEGGPVEVEHSDSPRDKLAGRLSSIATREAADQDTE